MILDNKRYIVTFGGGKRIDMLGKFLKVILRHGSDIVSWEIGE